MLRLIVNRYSNSCSFQKVVLMVLFFWSYAAYGQQDPLFTQYMFNKIHVNPAYAGTTGNLDVDILGRKQWVNIDGAPETVSLSAHTPQFFKNVGLGITLYRDKIGPTIDQGLMGIYAYRINFRSSTLSFALQIGFKYFDFDWNAMKLKDPDDLFIPQDVKRFTPDANLGLYYYTTRYYLGISSKQLLQNRYGYTSNNGKGSFSILKRHFYFIGGFAAPITNGIVFRPSALVKFTPNAPLQVDVNASFLFAEKFWAGASFRTGTAVALITELKITSILKVGYSYDWYLNKLQSFNYGSHEIRLGLSIPVSYDRMRTPRYF